ncbi:hypothetical protein [Arthrobacter rhombi]|uniref:hypothetical protein n=1 Tax=Arthrobacter rhombi TaxID=71253 RepID=UPI0011789C13|nr:hypothetical protein [Arthrobacter rhombi]
MSAELATVDGATFYPLAKSRVSNAEFKSIRDGVLGVAVKHGFPSRVSSHERTQFDRAACEVLHDTVDIHPADASCNEVWIAFNLLLLPDVMVWRYGTWNSSELKWSVAHDRVFSFARTTFGRLWWRAHLLGNDAASQLGEDEAVQIIERPRIGGYQRLGSAIAKRHLVSEETDQKMILLRDAMKRFTRKLAVISIYGLSTLELAEFVDETFAESEAAIVLSR